MISTTLTNTGFLVRKDKLSATQVRSGPARALTNGEVRLAVDSFALTSNNITYAALGDAMNYWQFFPTGEDGWGCIRLKALRFCRHWRRCKGCSRRGHR